MLALEQSTPSLDGWRLDVPEAMPAGCRGALSLGALQLGDSQQAALNMGTRLEVPLSVGFAQCPPPHTGDLSSAPSTLLGQKTARQGNSCPSCRGFSKFCWVCHSMNQSDCSPLEAILYTVIEAGGIKVRSGVELSSDEIVAVPQGGQLKVVTGTEEVNTEGDTRVPVELTGGRYGWTTLQFRDGRYFMHQAGSSSMMSTTASFSSPAAPGPNNSGVQNVMSPLAQRLATSRNVAAEILERAGLTPRMGDSTPRLGDSTSRAGDLLLATSPDDVTAGSIERIGTGVGTVVNIATFQVPSSVAADLADAETSLERQEAPLVAPAAPTPLPPPVQPAAPPADRSEVKRRNPKNKAHAKDRNKHKQQQDQLMQWGANLFHEVDVLEKDKLRLEASLLAIQEQRGKLQADLEHTRLRCQELEQQNVDLRRSQETQRTLEVELTKVFSQNKDLRKQLAAYAVEIDENRKEQERTTCELQHYQEAAEFMAEERHTMLKQRELSERQLREFEQRTGVLTDMSTQDPSGANSTPSSARGEGASLGSTRRGQGAKDLAAPGFGVDEELMVPIASFGDPNLDQADPKSELARVPLLIQAVNDFRHAYSALQEKYVAQIQEFSRFVADVKTNQVKAAADWQSAKEQIGDYEQLGRSIKLHISDLHRAANGTNRFPAAQDAYVATGNEPRVDWEAIPRIDATGDLDLQLQLSRLREQLQAEQELHALCKERVRQLEAPIIERRRRREQRLAMSRQQATLTACLTRNIAWEIRMAQKGFELEKVHERNRKREKRFVALFPQEMLLKWRKPGAHAWTSILDVWELIRIDYGTMTKACVIYEDVQPWLCFSLYTVLRSYDFIVPANDPDGMPKISTCSNGHKLQCYAHDKDNVYCDRCEKATGFGADVWKCKTCDYDLCARCVTDPREDALQCFMLSISRVAYWAKGAVPTRAKFQALKGWIKVEDYCMRRRMTLAQAFKEAINITRHPHLKEARAPHHRIQKGVRPSPVEVASERTRTSMVQNRLGSNLYNEE